MDSLSRRERQIIEALLSKGSLSVAEVRAAIDDAPGYDAVRTTLRILEKKGHVDHAQDGPRFVYRARIGRAEACTQAIQRLVKTFFDGSPHRAAMALLRSEEGELGETELRQLEKIINPEGGDSD